MHQFPLSPKYLDFINTTDVQAEFLEGTTASGKTTVGAGVKFMRMVSRSPKKFHILASKTTGTAEKNIIQQDNGILDIHRNAEYCGNGDKDNKLPHIKFEGKIIYVVGYDNADKWKLVLGGQYGCVYIDEVNTANIEFVREISTRNDYLLATLNPDDPNLPVYKEFVNRSRPFKKYAGDVPAEIMQELKEPEVPGWKYWFFTFHDNLSLSEEDIEKKKRSAPIGTKLYKNKILGLRGKASGLVFPNFSTRQHTESAAELLEKIKKKELKIIRISCGVDTAYSQKSPDTIAMSYQIVTNDRCLHIVDEAVYNNADYKSAPLSPSDVVKKLLEFVERNGKVWGYVRDVFVDSADQATITELNKHKRLHGCIYNFLAAYKKVKVIDRIKLQTAWISTGAYRVCDHCKEHIKELETYSWDEEKINTPEDRNDHTINAAQYGWIPYRLLIGEEDNNCEVDR